VESPGLACHSVLETIKNFSFALVCGGGVVVGLFFGVNFLNFVTFFPFAFSCKASADSGVCSPLSAPRPAQSSGAAVLGLCDGWQGPPQAPQGSGTGSTGLARAKRWAGIPLPATTGPHRALGKREAKRCETVIQHKSPLERKIPSGVCNTGFFFKPRRAAGGGSLEATSPSLPPALPAAASSPTQPPWRVGVLQTAPGPSVAGDFPSAAQTSAWGARRAAGGA